MNTNLNGDNNVIDTTKMNKPQENDLVSKLGKLLEVGDKDSLLLVFSVFESLTDTNQPKTNNTKKALEIFLYERIPQFIEILKPPVPNNLIGHIGFLVKNIEFKNDYKRLFNYPKLPRYFEANPLTKPRLYLRILHNNREPFTITPNEEEKRPGYFHLGHFCKLPKLPKNEPLTEKLVNQDGEVIIDGNLLEPFALSEIDKYFLLTEPSVELKNPYQLTISNLDTSAQSNLFQWFVVQSVSLSDGCKIMIQHQGTPFKCQLSKDQFLESQFHVCPLCQVKYTTPELSFLFDDDQTSNTLNLYHSTVSTEQAAQNLQNQQMYQQQFIPTQQSPVQGMASPAQSISPMMPAGQYPQGQIGGFNQQQNMQYQQMQMQPQQQQYIQQQMGQMPMATNPYQSQATNDPKLQQLQQQQQPQQQQQYQDINMQQYSPPEDHNAHYTIQDNQTNYWVEDNDFDNMDSNFDF